MAMAPGKWSLSDTELSSRFPHKERLPKMRELREDLNDQIVWMQISKVKLIIANFSTQWHYICPWKKTP